MYNTRAEVDAPCASPNQGAGFVPMSDEKPISEQPASVKGPIIIERNVWIATRVTILDGVTIGHDSIISAGSVVSTDIPSQSVAHGNPAKVILKRT